MDNPVIVAVAGGFYFFGQEIQGNNEGYVLLTKAAMFGGFGGGLGLPGVARGAKGATVTLDRFAPDETIAFPQTAVYAIMPSVDLYGSTEVSVKLRGSK